MSALDRGDPDTYWEDIENACSFYHSVIDEEGQLTLEEKPDFATSPHYCWGRDDGSVPTKEHSRR